MRYDGTEPAPVPLKVDYDESQDPYLNEAPPGEPARCTVCGNVYSKKRWYRSDQIELDDSENKITSTICPGCKKVHDHYYYGELHVGGRFLVEHHSEISHLIQNEVHRTQKKNPLSKLVEADTDSDGALFRTTNGKLAEHLGRALEKAYQGELEIKKADNVTRVFWERE